MTSPGEQAAQAEVSSVKSQLAGSLFKQGLAHHAEQRTQEAEPFYRRALELKPDHVLALHMLALIVIARQDYVEAESIVLRYLAQAPDSGHGLYLLGGLRTHQGDDAGAVELFRRALADVPYRAIVYNDIGAALHRLGECDGALDALDQAVALDPTHAMAHHNRGFVLLAMERFTEALEEMLSALRHSSAAPKEVRISITNGLARAARKSRSFAEAENALRAQVESGRDEAIEPLAQIIEFSGRSEEASQLLNGYVRRVGIRSTRSETAELRLIVLEGVAAGHVPIRYLIDPKVFSASEVTLLSADQPDAPLGPIDVGALREHDLVFNVLSEADRHNGLLESAMQVCNSLGLPVLNPPSSIDKTRRDGAAKLFVGIANLIVPTTRRIAAHELNDVPMDRPLLARPAGDHGGENLSLLRDRQDKSAYPALKPDEQLLLTDFHDFKSKDGFWRKYRFIFVDREVYPYHLAIGESWLLHYWRVGMARSEWKRAEEANFLADWKGVFGNEAAACVEEIARRLDLDYGGLDCALTADGRVLLFEANASFLLHLEESKMLFPYKHLYVPRIRGAFEALAYRRAGRSRSESSQVIFSP